MSVSLDPDQVKLLQDVAAGKVSRHRLRVNDRPGTGQDYQAQPNTGLQPDYRRATARLRPLQRLGLVELPQADPDVRVWKWSLTTAGRAAVAELNRQTETIGESA